MRRLPFAPALLVGCALAADAQQPPPPGLPTPRLGHVVPAGAKAGTAAEVTAVGFDLDEPTGLLFSHPGLTAERSGNVALLNDPLGKPTKFGIWSSGPLASPLTLDGDARLDLWSAIANFGTGGVDISVWLQDCDAAGTACTDLAFIDDVHVARWNADAGDWAESTWSLGTLDATVAAGRQLRLVFGFGHEDIWVAMSGDRPTSVVVTTA